MIGFNVRLIIVVFFRIHFGLVKVDFNDPERTRTPKASYTFFKNVVTTGRLITNSFSKKSEL